MDCSAHRNMTVMEFYDEAIELSGDGKWAACRPMFYHLLEEHTDVICEWNIRQFIGNAELYLENYEESILQLTTAATQMDASVDEMNFVLIHRDLGRALYCLGQYKKALEAYDKAEQHIHVLLAPGWEISHYTFYLGRGRTRLYLSQYSEALRDLLRGEEVIVGMSADEQKRICVNLFHYEIGRVHVYRKDWARASARLEKVDVKLLDDSHHSDYYHVMIRHFVMRREFDRAWAAYEIYMKAGPATDSRTVAEDEYMAGATLFHLGRLEEARSKLEKALDIEDRQDWVGEECEKYLALIKEADTGEQS